MENKFLASKAIKKKSALKGVWLLLALVVIFVIVMLKYLNNSGLDIGRHTLPNKEDAYQMSKNFLREDVPRSQDLDFSNDGYSFAKRGDSVFTIKATVIQKLGDGDTKKSDYMVTMRYKGGIISEFKNWDLLSISRN